MRSRGEGATEVFTAETMAAKFGVVEGSYDAVPLPRLEAHIVRDGLAYGAARPIHLLAESEELRVVPVGERTGLTNHSNSLTNAWCVHRLVESLMDVLLRRHQAVTMHTCWDSPELRPD